MCYCCFFRCFFPSVLFIIFAVFLIVFSVGCATAKHDFTYSMQESQPLAEDGPVLVMTVVDGRSDRSIDEVYYNPTIETLKNIMKKELENMGVFSRVMVVSEKNFRDNSYLQKHNVDYISMVRIEKLRWHVPEYTEMGSVSMITIFGSTVFGTAVLYLLKSFVSQLRLTNHTNTSHLITLSQGTGMGVGAGLIYGLGKTDVFGISRLSVLVAEADNLKNMWKQTYDKLHRERTTRFACDSSETKSRVVGRALKKVFSAVKKDISEMFL